MDVEANPRVRSPFLFSPAYELFVLGLCVFAIILMTVGVGVFATYTGFAAGLLLEPGEDKQTFELEQIRNELKEIRELLKAKTNPEHNSSKRDDGNH